LVVLEHGVPLTFEGPFAAHTAELYLFTAWVLYDDLRSKILLDKFHDFGYVKLRGVKVWLGRSLSIPPASSKA
jgi:hypothetical protein